MWHCGRHDDKLYSSRAKPRGTRKRREERFADFRIATVGDVTEQWIGEQFGLPRQSITLRLGKKTGRLFDHSALLLPMIP